MAYDMPRLLACLISRSRYHILSTRHRRHIAISGALRAMISAPLSEDGDIALPRARFDYFAFTLRESQAVLTRAMPRYFTPHTYCDDFAAAARARLRCDTPGAAYRDTLRLVVAQEYLRLSLRRFMPLTKAMPFHEAVSGAF